MERPFDVCKRYGVSLRRPGAACAKGTQQPNWVVIAAEPITELDTTAGDMLRDLDLELNAKGIHLAFAELQGPVREHLIKLGLQKTIDARNFYPTLDTAIEAIASRRHESGRSSSARIDASLAPGNRHFPPSMSLRTRKPLGVSRCRPVLIWSALPLCSIGGRPRRL